MSEIEQYATKFNVDRPGDEPTDANLIDALHHCALPVKRQWLPAIRYLVNEQRNQGDK